MSALWLKNTSETGPLCSIRYAVTNKAQKNSEAPIFIIYTSRILFI